MSLPETVQDQTHLNSLLSEPTESLVRDFQTLRGNLLVLGAAGKMGPSLTLLARRALEAAGSRARVIAVSRFRDSAVRSDLEAGGIETISCDLLESSALETLPEAEQVIHMAGMKFGSTGREAETWASNTYLAGRISERYSGSRIVAFSTGNVYPLTPVVRGGSVEGDPTGPVGEYAQSCLGRERMFEHGSLRHGTRTAIIRLNYAIDLRYGILLDIAQKVNLGLPVDVSMGCVNVIWQGDANERVLRSLGHCASPPAVLNVTGPETVSVRRLAERFGDLFGKPPIIEGVEAGTALLNHAGRSMDLFGYPRVCLERMIQWTADWVRKGGVVWNKPTHFETRDGRF